MPNSYIGKMATILWLQPQWAHRDKIPQCCNSTWKPMSKSSSVIKRYGNRYSDKLYPNTCCLFLDAYCVDKHQILCKSSKFLEFLLASYGIFRKMSYLCPRKIHEPFMAHRKDTNTCMVQTPALHRVMLTYHMRCLNKIFYWLNINELSITKNVTANDLETSYILFLSQLCNIQRTLWLQVER